MTDGPRGRVGVYALAFGLLVASAAVLGAAGLGLLGSTRLLWGSIFLSILAAVAALTSLAVPRR